jgi:hypothetical protein
MADDESTTRQRVPARERRRADEAECGRGGLVVLVLGLGAARRRAGSWPRRRTPTAQERRATEERLKIWGGEEKMTWRCGTHELGTRIGKLLEQLVFWG